MKKAVKMKSASAPRAVQTREQCVDAIARIGTLSRLKAQIVADADEQVSAIAKKRDADTLPLTEELKALNLEVQAYCEANREALTEGGKVKFHNFGTGKVSWRFRPPSVTVRGAEVVIEACRALGLSRFIRVKEELNKDAMLAEAGAAASIAGVSIRSEGEDFSIEVVELGNSEMAA